MRARWWFGGLLVVLGLACAGGPAEDAGGDKAGKGRKARSVKVEEPEDTEPVANGEPAAGGGDDGADADADTKAGPPKGITALGGNQWQVKRKLVQKWQDKPRKFSGAKEKKKGYALKGLRDARYCGFEEGDVIQQVNGYSVASPAEAAAAYASLQDARKLTVKFKRSGSALTHTYQIVD